MVNGEDYSDKSEAQIYTAAFYFAVATFTSVGYGDIVATTVRNHFVFPLMIHT